MGSDKEKDKLVKALEGLIPALKNLTDIDLDGALTSSLSEEDKAKVEDFKKNSDVIKEAQEMASKFNAKKWNV